MEKFEIILSIDIGGTSVKIGAVRKNHVIESTTIRNVFKGKPETLIPGIKNVCNQYIKRYNINKIGIGCPGDVFDGVVLFASNLGWKKYKILEDFQNNFPNFEIRVANDGNVACKAELKFGQLKDVKNGVFMTIGRGVGGAIIVDHQIVHGSYRFGGKIGHMVTHCNGRRCNCGRKGCFETYASVLGLIQTVKEYNEKTSAEYKVDVTKLSGFNIVQYEKNDNKMVKGAIKRWLNDISEGLLNLCNLIDPTIIVIAGGITESGLVRVEYIKNFLSYHGYENCDIKLATFKGKTGLVGAAALFDN